jgi:hypothetical protein
LLRWNPIGERSCSNLLNDQDYPYASPFQTVLTA